MADHQDPGSPKYVALFLVGGLCTGSGILSLYWSVGWDGGPLNSNFAEVGFTGIDNIALLGMADFGIPLLAAGILFLVLANAFAWKETKGY